MTMFLKIISLICCFGLGICIGTIIIKTAEKYRRRIAYGIVMSFGMTCLYLLLGLHYLAGITSIPIIPMLMFGLTLFFLMNEWRDQSVAYERFLVSMGDYMRIKAEGWDGTYKADVKRRFATFNWNLMSNKERHRFVKDCENADVILKTLNEMNLTL